MIGNDGPIFAKENDAYAGMGNNTMSSIGRKSVFAAVRCRVHHCSVIASVALGVAIAAVIASEALSCPIL